MIYILYATNSRLLCCYLIKLNYVYRPLCIVTLCIVHKQLHMCDRPNLATAGLRILIKGVINCATVLNYWSKKLKKNEYG